MGRSMGDRCESHGRFGQVYYYHFLLDLCQNIFYLYRQEGVDQGVYIPISVPIETPDGQTLICRAYRLTKLPPELHENEPIPFDRQPSSTYLKTIIKGAIESGLPEKYIEFLKHFKHNGNTVESIEKDLELSEIVI